MMLVSPSFSEGIVTILGSTEGTWTVAKSMVSFRFLSIKRAAILSDLLRINGNGREESTAIGVSTGYTSRIK